MLLDKKQNFGLGEFGDDVLRALALEAKPLLSAYWGVYADYEFANGLRLIQQAVNHEWGPEGEGADYRLTQPMISFDSKTEMTFLIRDLKHSNHLSHPDAFYLFPLTENNEYGNAIPVQVVHPWFQPCFVTPDFLKLKVAFVADQITLRQPAELDDQTQAVHSVYGFETPKSLMCEDVEEENDFSILLTGEMIESHEIPSVTVPVEIDGKSESFATEPMRHLTCKTPFGNVCVLARNSLFISKASRDLIQTPGAIISAKGFLVGDARTGVYKNGVVRDFVSFLKLLKSLTYLQSLKILSSYLRSNTRVFVDGEEKARGKDAVLDVLRTYLYKNHEFYYTVVRDSETKKESLGLVCRTDVNPINEEGDDVFVHWIMPCLSKDMKAITDIRIETCISKYETLQEVAIFESLDNPDFKLTSYGSHTVEKEQNRCYKFVGDEGYFPAEHQEGKYALFSYMLKEEKEIYALAAYVTQYGSVNKTLTRKIENRDFLTIESHKKLGEQPIEAYLTSSTDEGGFEFVSMMPRFQGLPCRAKVLATCAWPNEVGGEVALKIGKTEIIANVPAFYAYKDQLVIGRELDVKFSASVEMLQLQETNKIVVSSGPFYEAKLADFLQDNPDKTEEDFQPIEISTKGMVILFPRNSSTEYELASPVLSCDKTSFAGEEIYKLKVILYRQDDQEVYLNLYVAPSQLPDGLKEGSDVMGIVRLYAEPIAEAIN